MALALIALAVALIVPNNDDSVIRLLMVSGVLCVSGVLATTKSPFGVVSPIGAFVGGSLLYVVPSVLTLYAVGEVFDERAVGYSASVQGARFCLISLAVALVGYALGSKPPAKHEMAMQNVSFASEAGLGALLVSAVASSALLAFMQLSGGVGALRDLPYGERYIAMEGKGPLVVGIQVVTATCIFVIARGVWRGWSKWDRLALAICVGTLALWTYAIESRAAIVQATLGAVFVRHVRRRIAMPVLLVLLLALSALGLLLGPLRGADSNLADVFGAEGGVVSTLNPANQEFGTAVLTVGDIIQKVPAEVPFQLGASYVRSVGVVVPKVLWPSRPYGTAEWYVRTAYPEVADVGGGFAFSQAAEAYLNFGAFGAIIVFGLTGVGLARLERASSGLSSHLSLSAVAVSLFWCFSFMRSDSATILKSGLILEGGTLLACVWIGVLVDRLSVRLSR